jgi:hypothetical protein
MQLSARVIDDQQPAEAYIDDKKGLLTFTEEDQLDYEPKDEEDETAGGSFFAYSTTNACRLSLIFRSQDLMHVVGGRR